MDEELEDIPTAHLDAEHEEPTDGVRAAAPREPQAPAAVINTRVDSPTAAPIAQPVVQVSAPPAASAAPQVAESEERSLVERDISSGSLLCNRYVLGRLLGTGGSAFIFQAEDRRRIGAEDFGSRIAIKVLRPEVRRNAHALTRLKREHRQMQRLLHPGVARVFELACDEDVWFMTMELIDGQTINQWLKTNPPRALALQVIAACCDALAHAHETGVVHGDLKPSNVLVLADGSVKLVDFGSAAERDRVTGEVDKERSFAATPPYASPQILAGEVADPRDDVFSLACLAYAILTHGEHPFDRKSSAEAQQAGLRPAFARGLHPREFDVIVRGLAWSRDERPASVREFLHALLASDLRRETREGVTPDVSSKPMPSAPVRETVAPKVAEPVAAPSPSPHANTIVRGPVDAKAPEPAVAATPRKSRANSSVRKPAMTPSAEPTVAASSQPIPSREPIAPQAAEPAIAATPAKASEAPPATPPHRVHETLRGEDVARLKAALAAAEAHAERIDRRDTPPLVKEPPPSQAVKDKKRDKADLDESLARFRGYVAGPLAPHASAGDAFQAAAAKTLKRIWPWPRNSVFAGLLVLGATFFVVRQFSLDAEPIQYAEARPAVPVQAPTLEPAPAQTPVPATAIEAPPEKKNAPDVTKPKAAPSAPGRVSFATRTLQVGAGQTIAALTVKRTQSQRGRASVPWTIEAGTARAGVDYVAESPTIQFLDGQEVRTLFIKLNPDQDPGSSRHSKTFTVKLQPSTRGPQLGEINKVYVTIVGDVDVAQVADTEPGPAGTDL